MTVEPRPTESQSAYEVGHFIDGKTVAGDSGRSGDIAQPATGEIQGQVAFASSEEVDRAVAVTSRRPTGVRTGPDLAFPSSE